MITVDVSNLTEDELNRLAKIDERLKRDTKPLSHIKNGEVFKIDDIDFIKFSDENGITTAVAKDIVFDSAFGTDNDFSNSTVLEKLVGEFLPQIIEAVGIENICDIETDLTTLDGLKPYQKMTSKISLPTFDFYRNNVEIFDKYKLSRWWWLAIPYSARPHYDPCWVSCVSPDGLVGNGNYGSSLGVRPFLRFVSTIFVAYED